MAHHRRADFRPPNIPSQNLPPHSLAFGDSGHPDNPTPAHGFLPFSDSPLTREVEMMKTGLTMTCKPIPYPCRFFSRVLLAVCGLLLADNAAANEPASVDPVANGAAVSDAAGIEFFETHVRPILVDHCYECHSGDEASGGLLLDSRQATFTGGDTGPAVVSGQPDTSLLIRAVRYDNRDLQMPPQNRLSDAQIATLEKWISLGVPDPRETSSSKPQPDGMAIAEGREFWSFQPIVKPAIPELADSSWVRTPIDTFVLSSLQAKGLSPAPAADRRTLIRRVTYDLIGLPPTTQEVESFVADPSPDAFEKVVERLLASQQYGIRWGRHWLDVVRYADSNGLDENLAFGNAWRYRDYVVDAFNHDKPFDQFVVEQLAGDLLPDANQETKTATGFWVLGAKVLAEPDREKLEMDTIDEQLDATGKALLGMTIGCARCHDHKFDPIKQSDYYSLAAILKSTKTFGDSNTGAIKHWHEHIFATEEELAAIKETEAEIAKKKSAASTFKNQAVAKLRDEARGKATEYLVAATKVGLEMSLRQVQKIAETYDLHPRILHHCRRHLHFHQDDPVFQPWHEMAQSSTTEHAAAVERYYRPLMSLAEQPVQTPESSGTKQVSEPASDSGLHRDAAQSAIQDASGFLAVPPKPEFAFDAETLAQYDRLMEEARVFESGSPDIAAAMGVSDGEITPSLPIHIRGSHLSLGQPVDRAFPAVMRSENSEWPFPEDQSGRLELARWITSADHPLTARVYVNRIWRWHFGRGIVKSTENFGVLGDRPSHPLLLDWLASTLIQNGWSTKALHRLILASNTYQMASSHPGEWVPTDPDELASPARINPAELDPENRLLWKFRLQRLEAEQIHDSILATSGQLDRTMHGKTVPLRNRQFVFNHTSVDHTKYDSLRRAIYLPVIRNNLFTTFEQFDFPDPTMPTGDRNSTVVAPQALLLMNSEMVIDAADSLARELLATSASDSSRIETVYLRVLGRRPDPVETDLASAFLDGLQNTGGSDALSSRQAWSLLCQSLLACNEFIYLR